METNFEQTSAAYDISVGKDSKIQVNINLKSKEFTIEENINQLKNSGIDFSVGGCKNIELLKDLVNSVTFAIGLIESEFNKVSTPVEPETINN